MLVWVIKSGLWDKKSRLNVFPKWGLESPLWPEMGPFPYTPSLFQEEFSFFWEKKSFNSNMNVKKSLLMMILKIGWKWKFCYLYPHILGWMDGSDDDDLDRGCLGGLCEREMIKGREFLLISEVSAVPPSSCSDDNDYACQGDCWWNQWNCLEFYSGCNDL